MDGITIERFEKQAKERLFAVKEQIEGGDYHPQLIKRVWIDKPGSTEKRPLGILTVRDRVVQTSLRALLLLALALAQPFWGRDLAGAFPFWILSLAITIHWARQGIWRKAGRLAATSILACLVISSLLIRFAPWHKHDDYRGAAAEAAKRAHAGQTVCWVADKFGAG